MLQVSQLECKIFYMSFIFLPSSSIRLYCGNKITIHIVKNLVFHECHGSQSRFRPPTRRTLRQIGLGDSNWSWAINAKRYIESSKNSQKITTNLKKIDIHIHISHVQNISPSTLKIKRKHKYTRRRQKHIKIHAQYNKLHKLHS